MANEPQDIFLPVERTTKTTESLGVTLKRLVIDMAATGTAGKIRLELAPLDAEGRWLEGAAPVVLRREDALFESNPLLRHAASLIHELMLTAVVTDTPGHRALGIEGLSVTDAAKVIVNALGVDAA